MLTYGLDQFTKECKHIRNVENGLACGCVCPVCDTALVAQQGSVRDWHFRHHSEQECSFALETILHMRAKEILASARAIALPYLSVNEQAVFFDDGDILESVTDTIVDYGQAIALDDIKLIESSLGDIRPDLIVYSDGEPIAIEIAVTHFVDYEKRLKIVRKNISCIEINLSSFRDSELTDEDFIHILIEDVAFKDWIFHKDENPSRIARKRELAAMYGGEIQYVNREPDGVKFGYEYSELIDQLNLIHDY